MKRDFLSIFIALLFFMGSIPVSANSVRVTQTIKFKGKPENLGNSVNSEHIEKAPVISRNGDKLYFTRHGDPKNTSKKGNIWVSTIRNNRVGPAQLLTIPGVSEQEEQTVVGTSNGGIYLGDSYRANGKSHCGGVSHLRQNGNSWSNPELVGPRTENDFYKANKFVNEKGDIILVSFEDLDVGMGERDLFVIRKKADGSWTEALNLGAIVNTAGVEATPYLARDNKTLYFSSNGHPGYGQSDIFVTRRLDDTWQKWSTPENLGRSVNTAGHEGYFTLSPKNDYAYFVSTVQSKGSTDIFRIAVGGGIPKPTKKPIETPKPSKDITLFGTVLDRTTGEPVEAEVTFSARGTSKSVETNESGVYTIKLPNGASYNYETSARGYIPAEGSVNITGAQTEFNIQIAPIKGPTKTVRLENIYFNSGKATIKKESLVELDKVAKYLVQNRTVALTIAGHTDDIGQANYNKQLSQRRANSVVNYLVKQGIKRSRITPVGFGEVKPIDTNKTAEGRQNNRRVEFIIKQ